MGWASEYHAIAHDPLLRRGTAQYLGSPRLRYRRILIPAMAYLLAAGNDAFIDPAYRVAVLLFFVPGGWWLARLAQAAGKPAVLGIVFFLLPASVASIDREAVDVGLLCFCAGFALYTRYVKSPGALYGVLLFAGLVRDTGLLLDGGILLMWLLLERDFRRCALFATAAVPTFAWYAFVNSRTLPYAGAGAIAIPFSGVAHRLIHILDSAGGGPIEKSIRGTDLLAAGGVLLALMLAIRFIWRLRPDPVDLAILLFALLGIFIWRPGDWLEALDYGRILSPLLFFEALSALDGAFVPALVPLAMVEPRFGIEMASQALGIFKGLL